MKHQNLSLVGARKVRINYPYWMPDSAPRAVLLVVHGAGEHSGRYGYFVEHFSSNGFAVVALDPAGHRPGSRVDSHHSPAIRASVADEREAQHAY